MNQTKKELSLNVQKLMPSLFECGKVKIGKKGVEKTSKGGNKFQAPEKIDHFLITSTIRGKDNNFLIDELLMSKIDKGEDGKIRRIPITFLYDDISLNFQSRYACYMGKTLFCSGNGIEANQVVPDENKKIKGYNVVPCTCHRADFNYSGKDKCKITGKLQFIIRGSEKIGGVHVFRTTGRNSVVSILSSLTMIQRITGGCLAGIPLDLVISPKQVLDPDGNAQTIYVVSVEFIGDMIKLQEDAHNILLNNAKHGIQISKIEDEAKKLISANPSPFTDELEDDDRDEYFTHTRSDVEVVKPVENNLNSLVDDFVQEDTSLVSDVEGQLEQCVSYEENVEDDLKGKIGSGSVNPYKVTDTDQEQQESETNHEIEQEPESFSDPLQGDLF